jgi:hypothetical protein
MLLGRSEGDVFNGEHRFQIDPIENNNNKVNFIQSEKFTGSMVASLEGWLDKLLSRTLKI